MPRRLRIDIAHSPESTAPPLSPVSTAPSCGSIALTPGELSSPIVMGNGKDELAYSPFPDVPPLLLPHHHQYRTPHSPTIPLPPLHVPSHSAPPPHGSALSSTPTAELGPFEYPVPAPDSEAGRRAAHGAPSSPEYVTPRSPPTFPPEMLDRPFASLEVSVCRSLPEERPIHSISTPSLPDAPRKGHAHSPSSGSGHLPRLAPSHPRRGSTIAFAHTPLPAPIPPSLLRRRSTCTAPPPSRPSTSPKTVAAARELPHSSELTGFAPHERSGRPPIRPRPPPREKSLTH